MSLLDEAAERLQRRPMALEEYLALPEGVRAEYVGGEAVVSPPPRSGHNKAARRLAHLIETHLAEHLDVVTESGWRSGATHRIPDVAVYEVQEDVVWYDQVPLLVVEVLSPSTRAEDTLRKSVEYLRAGVRQFWVLDRELRTLTVLTGRPTDLSTGGEPGWDVVLHLGTDRPRGEVVVGGHGTVPVDLEALLAP